MQFSFRLPGLYSHPEVLDSAGQRLRTHGELSFRLYYQILNSNFALLERALINFMLDTHILKNSYVEISPPLLVSENTMFGTGQLPKFENDQFEIKLEEGTDRKFLIPTAEVILTNIVKDKIVS